ncbi:MAG: hypothetical protein ACJAWD_000915 [Methylophilaceae bacterium]|jgi:hypothetical protein
MFKKINWIQFSQWIVKRMPELASSSLTRQLILRIAPEIIRQLFE